MTPDKREHFRRLAPIDALGRLTVALLTTSEVVIVDSREWKCLLRQKHRRDPDPSILMKIFSTDDGAFHHKKI
jgi:hypothetical protein